MAPSEESILGGFLLSPASLPTVISLQKFTELFPKRLQSHPQIKVLYRELQELRSQDMDLISEHILDEVKAGEQQKADLLEAAKASGVSGFGDADHREMNLDLELFGPTSSTQAVGYHSFSSLLSEMESSCAALEREVSAAEKEATSTLTAVRQTIGDLSDLRYGKLNKPGVNPDEFTGETIRGLQGLQDACDRANNMES
jgi:centromere-localized protein 2